MKLYQALCLFLFCGCSLNPSLDNNLEEIFYQDREFISIMQGPTSENETILNFLVPKNMTYRYKILDKKNNELLIENIVENIHAFPGSPWKIVELEIKSLRRNENYQLEISLIQGKFEKKESRFFSTIDLQKENVEILLASCLTDSYEKIAEKAWTTISRKNVDALFLIGDLVYADFHNDRYLGMTADSLKSIWSRYVDSRNRLPLFRMKKLKPVFAIWDDHDTGMNDADKNYKFIKETKDIFRSFFRSRKIRFSN